MNELFDDVALERRVKDQFGVAVEIDAMIARHLPVGPNIDASLFLTTKKQLFLYVHGEAKLLLSDIRKIVSRVGLTAELFLPPKNQPNYFSDVGRRKFQEVFPGRRAGSDEDIAFYRTLAPYNPALVLIMDVKVGIIYQYDSDARGQWRPHAKFSYRRIKTS